MMALPKDRLYQCLRCEGHFDEYEIDLDRDLCQKCVSEEWKELVDEVRACAERLKIMEEENNDCIGSGNPPLWSDVHFMEAERDLRQAQRELREFEGEVFDDEEDY